MGSALLQSQCRRTPVRRVRHPLPAPKIAVYRREIGIALDSGFRFFEDGRLGLFLGEENIAERVNDNETTDFII